jgi:hypothetical protein
MADSEELVDLVAVMPARVRMANGRVVEPVGERAIDVGEDAFFFEAEISSTALDAYFTHMADSTLRNFASDAAVGVSLLDSHDGYKLGVGYSAGGRYEEEDGIGRVVVSFYIVPGIRFGGNHSFASSDDYIRAIRSGVVRDVSVGFHGGRWICDLCKQPYFGQGSACNHVAGYEYEVERDGRLAREVCTVAIHDARLSEVSLVYDGATPGAMILKAEQEAEAGRLSPVMARQLERQYRVRLPKPKGVVIRGELVTATTAYGLNTTVQIDVDNGRSATGGAPAMGGQGDGMSKDVEVQVEAVEPEAQVEPEVQAEDSEARAAIEAVRRALTEVRAPEGIALDAAVRGLGQQLTEARAELEQSRAEVARLQPLADQGRAYRDELVNQAVAEGVRALGETFPEETYRAMLTNAPLEHIRQVRDTFAEQAAVRFPGGRQTQDAPKNDGDNEPQRQTPVAAYGVK